MKDYYDTLGVAKSASADEIKSAYRKMAAKYHPDHNKAADAEEKFKEINEAYQVLSDPQKRKLFDQGVSFEGGGQNAGAGGSSAGGYTWTGGSPFGGMEESGGTTFDFDSFGGIDSIFDTFFGGGSRSNRGRRGRSRSAQGEDLELQVTISLQEAAFGTEKSVEYNHMVQCATCKGQGGQGAETCSECKGKGQVARQIGSMFGNIAVQTTCPQCRGEGKTFKTTCPTCQGSGRVSHKNRMKIKVPQGAYTGMALSFEGEGNAGIKGGDSGALYIRIKVAPDKTFSRDGDDVYSSAKLPVVTAVLGGTTEVSTLHGNFNLKIPAGTQGSTLFRIRGKGMGKLRSQGFGDHYVKVEIEIPKRLSRQQKKLWKELTLA